uniref:Uncharacterized protein n=1 Tax=Alexandrium monilatum TaxID=311494 RepID=A0A7S4PZ63_9DINO|mmetsp:Transcript_100852/g.311020  ORF Transcript_100852/g.311020 Transcript_100852/m.311020 type:complete len:182 (-) Transcript_100852:42-587(-)
MPHGLLLSALAHWPGGEASTPGLEDCSLQFQASHHASAALHTAFAARRAIKPVPEIEFENDLPRDREDGKPLCCNEQGEEGDFAVCQRDCSKDPRFSRRKLEARARKDFEAEAKAESQNAPRRHRPAPAFKHLRKGEHYTWWDLYMESLSEGGIGLERSRENGPVDPRHLRYMPKSAHLLM